MKMSSFPTLKAHLSYLGCIPYRNIPRWLQAIQIAHIFFCLAIFVWSTFESFLYEADNSGMYIESFIITCSSIIALIAYLMMIRCKGILVKHLNEFDEFMETSEKRCFFLASISNRISSTFNFSLHFRLWRCIRTQHLWQHSKNLRGIGQISLW